MPKNHSITDVCSTDKAAERASRAFGCTNVDAKQQLIADVDVLCQEN